MSGVSETVLRTLRVDATLIEVVDAFADHGIPAILLKGQAVAAWLYPDDPDERPYGDVDLLVPPQRWEDAAAALRARGFRDRLAGAPYAPRHAETFFRREPLGVSVDLHRVPPQVECAPQVAWRALAPHSQSLRVAGRDVRVLDRPAQALVVALHAAHHPHSAGQPARDLARAVDACSEPDWRTAAELAQATGTAAAMAAGLRRVAGGDALATHLGLPDSVPRPLRLVEHHDVRGVRWIGLVAEADGVAAKARCLRAMLAPPRESLRYGSSLARRGPRGLRAAYAVRPLAMAARLPRAARTYARAARDPAVPSTGIAVALLRATWTVVALRGCRTSLRTVGLDGVDLPSSRRLAPGERGLARVLRLGRASCLERSLVRQAWAADHGERRDLIIGVTAPADGFRAHAWLDGDPGADGFTEILRRPPAPH